MNPQPEQMSTLATACYKRLRYIRRSIGYDVNRFLDFLWISKSTYYRLKDGNFPKEAVRSQILARLAELDASGELPSEKQQRALKDVRIIFRHKNAEDARVDEVRRLRNRASTQPAIGQGVPAGTFRVIMGKEEQHILNVLIDALRSMQISVIWFLPATDGGYLQEE